MSEPIALTAQQQLLLYRLQRNAEQKVIAAQRRYNKTVAAIEADYKKALKRHDLPDIAITLVK